MLVSGRVTDAASHEPLSFVNVYLSSDFNRAANTDSSGHFRISIRAAKDSLCFSSIGYMPVCVGLRAGVSVYDVALRPSQIELQVAEVRALKDPVKDLLRKIQEHKPVNNYNRVTYFEASKYCKFEMDVAELSKKISEWWLVRPFKFFFRNVDTTFEQKPLLPIFIKETSSQIFHRKQPLKNAESIQAVHYLGFEVEQAIKTLQQKTTELNPYYNIIRLYDQSFVSPVSSDALLSYHYQIHDTVLVDERNTIRVSFVPKRSGEKTFTGEMQIDLEDYAIRQLRVKPSGGESLNLIRDFSMALDFRKQNDSLWMPVREELRVIYIDLTDPIVAQFSRVVRERAPNLASRQINVYSHYRFDYTQEKQRLMDTVPFFVDEKSREQKSERYWSELRPIPLTSNEAVLQHLVDSFNSVPAVKALRIVISSLTSGQFRVGPVTIGNAYTFYQHNNIEGHRFSLGIKTSTKLSKTFSAGLYGAYGLGDKRAKYGADFTYLLQREPRQQLDVHFKNDIVNSRWSYNNQNAQGLLDANFRRREGGRPIPQKLSKVREFNMGYLHEWSNGFSLRAQFTDRNEDPFFNHAFEYSGRVYNSAIHSNEIGLQLRYAFREQFFSGYFTRIPLRSKYPVVAVNYALGLYHRGLRIQPFHRAEVSLSYKAPLRIVGNLWISAKAGAVFGTLPYLLLYLPKGNEGWIYQPEGFNLLREYEYAFNHYQLLILDHHFEGILLGRIPLVKQLDWREVVSFRMFYGEMSAANRAANRSHLAGDGATDNTVQLKSLNGLPYMEANVGIENIFRFFRVDAIWKLTHRTPQRGSNFGVRVYFQARF